MITGLKASTFQNLQLDAGVILKEFDPSTYNSLADFKTALTTAIATKCIGATKGGGKFTATPKTHTVEPDGKRYEFVGSTRVDTWDIKLSTTLIEITAESFALAIGSGSLTGTSVKKLTINTNYTDDSYVENLCWVGDLSGGGMVAIVLTNALNTTGASFTFTDKGEGDLPVEFAACQANATDYNTAPAQIYFFNS